MSSMISRLMKFMVGDTDGSELSEEEREMASLIEALTTMCATTSQQCADRDEIIRGINVRLHKVETALDVFMNQIKSVSEGGGSRRVSGELPSIYKKPDQRYKLN